jgi:hypothetical protein
LPLLHTLLVLMLDYSVFDYSILDYSMISST